MSSLAVPVFILLLLAPTATLLLVKVFGALRRRRRKREYLPYTSSGDDSITGIEPGLTEDAFGEPALHGDGGASHHHGGGAGGHEHGSAGGSGGGYFDSRGYAPVDPSSAQPGGDTVVLTRAVTREALSPPVEI